MIATSVTLIGMPGVGKSTVGVLLAKKLALPFVDTDLLFQVRYGQPLQKLLTISGRDAFLAAEEEVLLSLDPTPTVIATGGSAIYSDKGITALKSRGPLVWLDLPWPQLLPRLGNLDQRGVVRGADEEIADLAIARLPLYSAVADLRIAVEGFTPSEIVMTIVARLSSGKDP
ncbi:MAG: shikimate kinase [Desulfuromonas sp.]|nr:MAG: shikimate kinase [Desulfuromonas sp.]